MPSSTVSPPQKSSSMSYAELAKKAQKAKSPNSSTQQHRPASGQPSTAPSVAIQNGSNGSNIVARKHSPIHVPIPIETSLSSRSSTLHTPSGSASPSHPQPTLSESSKDTLITSPQLSSATSGPVPSHKPSTVNFWSTRKQKLGATNPSPPNLPPPPQTLENTHPTDTQAIPKRSEVKPLAMVPQSHPIVVPSRTSSINSASTSVSQTSTPPIISKNGEAPRESAFVVRPLAGLTIPPQSSSSKLSPLEDSNNWPEIGQIPPSGQNAKNHVPSSPAREGPSDAERSGRESNNQSGAATPNKSKKTKWVPLPPEAPPVVSNPSRKSSRRSSPSQVSAQLNQPHSNNPTYRKSQSRTQSGQNSVSQSASQSRVQSRAGSVHSSPHLSRGRRLPPDDTHILPINGFEQASGSNSPRTFQPSRGTPPMDINGNYGPPFVSGAYAVQEGGSTYYMQPHYYHPIPQPPLALHHDGYAKNSPLPHNSHIFPSPYPPALPYGPYLPNPTPYDWAKQGPGPTQQYQQYPPPPPTQGVEHPDLSLQNNSPIPSPQFQPSPPDHPDQNGLAAPKLQKKEGVVIFGSIGLPDAGGLELREGGKNGAVVFSVGVSPTDAKPTQARSRAGKTRESQGLDGVVVEDSLASEGAGVGVKAEVGQQRWQFGTANGPEDGLREIEEIQVVATNLEAQHISTGSRPSSPLSGSRNGPLPPSEDSQTVNRIQPPPLHTVTHPPSFPNHVHYTSLVTDPITPPGPYEWAGKDYGYGGGPNGQGSAPPLMAGPEPDRERGVEVQEIRYRDGDFSRPRRGSSTGFPGADRPFARRGRGNGFPRGYHRNGGRGGLQAASHQRPLPFSVVPSPQIHPPIPDPGLFHHPQQPVSYLPTPYEPYINVPPVPPSAPTPVQAAPPPVPVPLSSLSFPLDATRYFLLGQLEYYLSPQNMAQDFFLRQQMDSRGWIPVPLIASFNRVKQLTVDAGLVKDVLILSNMVQVEGDWVRMNGWEQFVLPDAPLSYVENMGVHPNGVIQVETDEEKPRVHDGVELDEEEEEEDVEFVMGGENGLWTPQG